jgi:hypothetical protein
LSPEADSEAAYLEAYKDWRSACQGEDFHPEDVVTVLATKPGTAANKTVTKKQDGTIKKSGVVTVDHHTAMAIRVPNAQALAAVLRMIAEMTNVVLCLGRFKGIEVDPETGISQPFQVVSQKRMARLLGVKTDRDGVPVNLDEILGVHEVDGERHVSRLKANMEPSTWVLIDRDFVEDQPEDLIFEDDESYWDALCRIAPSLKGCARVVVRSTSSRVLDGEKPISDKASAHFFVQRRHDDERPLEELGTTLQVKSFAVGLGFRREKYSRKGENKGQVVGHVPWSIFDPTTFSPERLVYAGKPVVRGEGLSVGPAEITPIEGTRWDTHDVTLPEGEQAEEIQRDHGITVERGRSRDGDLSGLRALAFHTVDKGQLRLSTPLDLGGGSWKTVEDLWVEGATHVRCQTPFRDSESMNALRLR